jgi:hypothetical protein
MPRRHSLALALASVVSLAFLASSGAAEAPAGTNPKVTLKVLRATPAEAAAALARAAGVRIAVNASTEVPDGQPAADLDGGIPARADFTWTNLSLARALRQLADRFNLVASRDRDGGYTLRSNGPNPRPKLPEKFPGFVAVRDIRFWVSQLSLEHRRTLNFREEQPGLLAPPGGRLQLQLQAELPDGDTDAVVGFEHVTAKDDTGSILLAESRLMLPMMRPPGLFGPASDDQWDEMVYLSAPHPRATRLVWLEGDLTAYATNNTRELELPAPLPTGAISRPLGEVVIESVQLETGPVRTQLRIGCQIPRSDNPVPTRPDLVVVLVGESGNEYTANSTNASGSGNGERTAWRLTVGFSGASEPIKRVLIRRTERSRPTVLAHFRMRDIPLPQEGVFITRAAPNPGPMGGNPQFRPGRGRPAAPAEPPPFRQVGGATLISQVTIGQRPAAAGVLSIGLSRKGEGKDGAEWGPIRWQELPVGDTGVAKLPDLEPGTYRVMRLYGPKAPLNLRGPGLWSGAEVEIAAAAGKELSLPPLEWRSDPATPAPTGAPKPSAAKPLQPKPKPSPKKK